jgi:general secretion pathway protein B
MSYILEALKRAEADRKAEAAMPPARRRPAAIAAPRLLWPWLVGGGLVLNALVGGAVFLVTRGLSPAVNAPSPIGAERTQAVAETPPAVEAPRASTPIAEQKAAEGAAPLPRRREAPAVASPGPDRSPAPARPTPPSSRTTPAQPPVPQQRTAPVQSTETPQPTAPTQPSAPTQAIVPVQPENREPLARPQPGAKAVATPPPPSAINLQELASKLKIEVLVWSDNPKDRMVFLNGRKYVEGQTLTGGAVIELIAEDGIVLVHEGQRVRVQPETK